MANEKSDGNNKKNSDNDIRRQVTHDSRNSSTNMGGKPEPAALDFDFDNTKAKSAVSNNSDSNRTSPDRASDIKNTDVYVPFERSADIKKTDVYVPLERSALDFDYVNTAADPAIGQKLTIGINKSVERLDHDKPAKMYGLPPDPEEPGPADEMFTRMISEMPGAEVLRESSPKSLGLPPDEDLTGDGRTKAGIGEQADAEPAKTDLAESFTQVKDRLKKKISERREASKAAKAAAEAKKLQLARQEELARAARESELALKAEAEAAEAAKAAVNAADQADASAGDGANAGAEMTGADGFDVQLKSARAVLAGAARGFISFFNTGLDADTDDFAYPDFDHDQPDDAPAGSEGKRKKASGESSANKSDVSKASESSSDKAGSKADKNTDNKKDSKSNKDAKSGGADAEGGSGGKKNAKKGGNVKNATKTGKAGQLTKDKAAAQKSKKSDGSESGKGVSDGNGKNGSDGGSGGKKGKGGKAGDKPVKKKKKKSKLWWLWAIIKLLLALAICGCIAGGAYAAITISKAPTIHPDRIYETLDVSTHIYDDKGKLIDDIFISENREIAKYDQLPDNLKNAFIAIEDKTFWTHKGFNFKRMFGAVWNSLTGGGEISGTSTITQQLARNVFLPEEKSIRSVKRKIIEMYYAHVIEETLSKEEILTAYLNTIYLGYGCYGVDTAARKYFASSLEDLTLEQCAALAALPQAPGVYALIVTEPGDSTTDIGEGLYANDISADRRNLVLDLMAEQGYVTAEEAEAAKKPLEDFIKPGGVSGSTFSAFKDYLIETVKKDLMTTYNINDEQASKLIYTKGLNIYSTLDSQAQRTIAKQFKKKSNFPSAADGKSKVEAAMVIAEVGTGQIKAMAGTRNANAEKLFNRAVSPRQPGSSIKPVAVYAPALQKSYEYHKNGQKFKYRNTGYDKQGTKGWGDYITAYSTVIDEKMVVNGKVWPKNFSRTYTGFKTFRTAIQQSINTCSVKILAQIGIDYSMDMVKKFGISTVIDDTDQPSNDLNLAALGLGAMTVGVTPLDMALAYAAFPNEGVVNSGICYTKVTDSDGKIILEGKSEETRVLDKGVAFIMRDVLQSVVSDGIAHDAAITGEAVGGKTGTTDETWDIWFDGFTANYSAALWIGTDDNVPLDATSARAAALWGDIMSSVKRARGGTYKSRPDNVSVKFGEYFTKGTEPPDPPPKKTDKDKDKDKDKTDKKDSGSGSKDSKKDKN